MRLACEIQNITRRMQSRGSKDDLRQQVAQVTIEMNKLEDKVHDLRDVFTELDSLHAEAGGCCFPFKYIMLKDMVDDVNELANNLQLKWYGATDQSNKPKTSRGVVNRLLENCRAFTASRQALSRYEVILDGLHGLTYKELERTLQERQTCLAQHRVVFSQLQDLLKQLQDLQKQSQETWLCARYQMLQRGVHSALAAFRSVAGLAESLPTGQSSGDDRCSLVNNQGKNAKSKNDS